MIKANKIMFNILLFSCFYTLFSCENNIYYKTFDYTTMTFKKPLNYKNDHCVRFISQSENKIEFEVLFLNNAVKRTFVKKDNYWYSKYKYETVPVPGYAVSYGDKYENEYFIFNDHIVYKMHQFIIYVDFDTNKAYYFKDYKESNFKDVKVQELPDKLWVVIDYYTKDGVLYKRSKYYENGAFNGEQITDYSHFPVNLDIFFWLDEDIYYPGPGIEPIYE